MHITPLVSPQWLHDNLNNPAIGVIDNSWEQNAYGRAHIAGAIPVPCHPHLKHFDAAGDKTSRLLNPDEFRQLCEDLGLRRDCHYVLYDDWHGLFSARFWWVCRYYGFDNVSILNGGWQGWRTQGRPVSSRIETPKSGTDVVPAAHPELLVEQAELLKIFADPAVQLWDTRRAAEFCGAEETGNQRPGHIPGACNLSWTDLLTEADNEGAPRFFRPLEELENIVTDLGLQRDKPIVPYCQNGIRAAFGLLALHLLGFERLRLYDGSMFEWANCQETPLSAD